MTTQRPRRRRRLTLWAAAAVAACVVLLATGWVLASAFRSPAQIEAEASPPAASVITAPVSQGQLADTMTVDGVVSTSARSTTAFGGGEERTVVTESPVHAGQRVNAGAVILEANNKPVFAVPGRFPFFRDIVDGDTGHDVEQLQAALDAAGLDVVVDGEYGPTTQAAVRALYERAGYSPPEQEAPVESKPDEAEADTDGAAPADAVKANDKAKDGMRVVARANAFVVVKSLPATAVVVPPLGAVSADAEIELSSGKPVIKANVLETTAALLEPGTEARIEQNGDEMSLRLKKIGEPDDDGGVDLIFQPVDAADLEGKLGDDVVVTIVRSVVAEDALLVPSSAVASRGDDRYVLIETEAQKWDEVPVHELGALNGTSAIEPSDADKIAAGDRVRVE